jgi:Ribonuclease G/E
MTELDLAITRASFAETREIDLTWKLGVYKNALNEIQRRIQNRPSPAILFEIDEIIKKALEAS